MPSSEQLDVHPLAAAAFGALETAGVHWSLLRGERRLAAPPHDVDLLIAPADVERAVEAHQPPGTRHRQRGQGLKLATAKFQQ